MLTLPHRRDHPRSIVPSPALLADTEAACTERGFGWAVMRERLDHAHGLLSSGVAGASAHASR